MLEVFRQGANTWPAKVLLAILALSFVLLFGPGNFNRVITRQPLASVGGAEITDAEFQRAYENEINTLSQRARRRITAEEARMFGLDRRVLSRLVGTTALDSQARALGLALSDESVAQSLQADPNFKGLDGRFDRAGFDALLRSLGMNERAFFAQKRKEDVREQLTGSVLSAIVTPKPIVAAVHGWKEETRVIEHVTIDADKAVTVAEPDAAKLNATYDGNKAAFMAPEYRKLQILLLSVDELKKDIAISDAEIATAYEQTKDSYATPELRRVQQISFKDKASAVAAKAAIDGGKNFMTVAQEAGFKDSDVEIGLVNKKALIDPKIATAAFALDRDKVSDVVEGRFTTVLLRVPEIKPGNQPSLAEVSDRVRDKLARAKAKDDVQRLRDQVDDLRNAAKSDVEIAASTTPKLKIVEVAETDSNGKTKDGKPAFEQPDAQALIAAGFDVKTGTERDAVDLADGGYGWVQATGTTPARQKPFDEVAADVKALYLTTERKRLVQELAQTLSQRLTKGEAIDAIATEVSGKADKTAPVTRTTLPQGLTENAVAQAFALPQGRAGSAETADKKTRILFRVAEIKPAAAPTKEQTDKLVAELGQQIQIDILDAYVAALQDKVGVTINDAELRRLAGSPSAQ
jgi:peptidyl-prolyl cis-trans isomerase D